MALLKGISGKNVTSTLIFKTWHNLAVQLDAQQQRRTTVRYALSFYGTLGFLAGFFGSRLFATLTGITVVHSGIHFHHFWYGLLMVVVTGWLGIAITTERLGRLLASIFGLGVGLIGDEVGLLLTFGDYQSEITAWFFAGAISAIILITLTVHYRDHFERDVLGISNTEHMTHAGVFLAVFSSVFFAFNSLVLGTLAVSLGSVLFLLGTKLERRPKSLRAFT